MIWAKKEGCRMPSLPLLLLWGLTSAGLASSRLQPITFGVILPKTTLITLERRYNKRILDSVDQLSKSRGFNFSFGRHFKLHQPQVVYMSLAPNPTEILSNLCNELLSKDVVAVLYFTNSEVYGSNAASAQYILQLMGYLGIPVIAWNADNIGLEQNQRLSESRVLQLAPSVEHQSAAMLSILQRYSWHQFSVVTTHIGGHDDFVRAIRDQVTAIQDYKFSIIDIFVLKGKTRKELQIELEVLGNSEARIILLYCIREEAIEVMAAAEKLGMTDRNYVWIVTQSAIKPSMEYAPPEFPPGMLGIHFNTTIDNLLMEIERAIWILGHGLDLYVNDPKNNISLTLSPNLSCNGSGDGRWNKGDHFFKYLRSVSIRTKSGHPNLEFNADGTLKHVELEIMNLNKKSMWDKIGVWTEKGQLEIKDIVWPGDSPVPPAGVPEKFNLVVTFMEEPPYINLVHPDNETGECETSRAVRCRVASGPSLDPRNSKHYMCCSGFCVDLLEKFANDLKFTYDLYRVEDGVWGIYKNSTWNGLVKEILSGKADLAVTALKINSERQTAVDFTVPFMETGIAIAVLKKTGIISPKAFLEPFDTVSWLMILILSIQVAALAIFFFEWISPYGYNMKMIPPNPNHRFSLFRTYWLVWAILFGAAVHVDCPRGFTARFMSNVWAMFAVVFLAIYTANLAAFMITREEFHDLGGIDDPRLKNPWLSDPPFRFGTIPNGNTEAILRKNKAHMYNYMKKFNKQKVEEGIKAIKKGELDAFVYDATVLEYLVGQDNDCSLLTVGSWYSMTGYGFALPKKSKYLHMFNRMMIKYKENGDIERLQRFWLQGICKPSKQKRKASNPLDINQFMSAFLLLGCGVLFTMIILGLEHLYFRSIRRHLPHKSCFTLFSLSMGKSLNMGGKMPPSRRELTRHRQCKNPCCDEQLWKLEQDLNLAHVKIDFLEKQISQQYNSKLDKNIFKNHINNHHYQPHYQKNQVAEIETVL